MGKLISGSSFSISATVPRQSTYAGCAHVSRIPNRKRRRFSTLYILYNIPTHRIRFEFAAPSNIIPSRHSWTGSENRTSQRRQTDTIFSVIILYAQFRNELQKALVLFLLFIQPKLNFKMHVIIIF